MSARARDARGFTLIEMAVTMALIAVVVGVLSVTLSRTRREADRIESLVEQRQQARAAVQLLERDVRMSGSGWGRTPVVISVNGVPDTIFAITPGYVPGVGSSDSLLIMGAWAANTTIADPMPSASANIKVVDTSGFADGDMVVITDGNTAHVFEVTQVSAGAGILQHNPASPYNNPGGFSGWPAGGYGVGSQVFKVSIVSYRVDQTSYRRRALMRREFKQAQQIVAYDVDRFQVFYRLHDGTVTRNPGSAAAVTTVDKVRPVVFTRLTDPSRPAYVDSTWAEVQPRAF